MDNWKEIKEEITEGKKQKGERKHAYMHACKHTRTDEHIYIYVYNV